MDKLEIIKDLRRRHTTQVILFRAFEASKFSAAADAAFATASRLMDDMLRVGDGK
jgi:hypothetical protein